MSRHLKQEILDLEYFVYSTVVLYVFSGMDCS